MKKYLVVLVGPTAIGKTGTAIYLANQFDTEIISADSRQFFKEMAIGTAKPTDEERAQAVHHFVDFLSIHEKYSAGQFESEALAKIEELHQKHDVVIMAGGSGLYVDAVCKGMDELPHDPSIREALNKRLDEEGIDVLQNELKTLDPTHFDRMDIHNPHRLIRALEVCLVSGQPYSSLRSQSAKSRPFEIIKIGLEADRETIYERINQRVDIMIKQGLEEECFKLLKDKDLNALNTVGYKEFFTYFEAEEKDLDFCIEQIKMNTRRFAKRQLTWNRKDQDIRSFHFEDRSGILHYLNEVIV